MIVQTASPNEIYLPSNIKVLFFFYNECSDFHEEAMKYCYMELNMNPILIQKNLCSQNNSSIRVSN